MFPFEKFIRERLTEKRFRHSVNVARAARWLAFKYDANEEKAVIAGMLHDITKEWKVHEHMAFLHNYNIGVTSYEYSSKKLFHSITGACFVNIILKIPDMDIFNAIRFHTTARAGMSKLEKIVYLADFISEDRCFGGVDKLRALASFNLNDAVFAGLSDTIQELSHNNKIIHPNTLNAYNEYILVNEREKSLQIGEYYISKCLSTKSLKKSVFI